ncbi:hypothetical protein DAI22_11g126550 [Oryza sativa Japonica Group]|nr:hypothetical protein DAI22_11g126550 [Oryza sativa Japonica Group]
MHMIESLFSRHHPVPGWCIRTRGGVPLPWVEAGHKYPEILEEEAGKRKSEFLGRLLVRLDPLHGRMAS